MKFASIARLALVALASLAVHGWVPTVGDSWNYNLETPVKIGVDVDVVFMDMDDENSQSVIDSLHDEGKAVVCYISIGTVEEWRDDADKFPDSAIGNVLGDWPGERWLDVNNEEVKSIMVTRVVKAADMDCDGIEPDNMSVHYEKDTGVEVSRGQQRKYNTWFADQVHGAGMKVGLKNTVELVHILEPFFDFAINESCYEWDECHEYYDTFLAAGKPVFNVEYTNNKEICHDANELGMDTIIKNYDLDYRFCSCSDSSRDVQCEQVLATDS